VTGEPRDLRAYATILWRWKALVAAFLLVIPATVYAYVTSQPEVYESSVLMQVQQVTVDTSLFADPPPLQPQSLAAAARRITTTAVARGAAAELGDPPSTARSLLADVTATADMEAGFITITASAATSRRAADVANAFAAAVVTARSHEAVARLDETIARISEQLDALGRTDRDGRRQLSQQLQRLRAMRAAQGDNASVVEPAVASTSPIEPSVTRTVVLAAIVAALLAFGAVVLAQGADRRLRDPLELERITERPLLSVIPSTAFGKRQVDGAAEASFQTLRASITYFNVGQPLASVLVSSPARGDGKTTVAANLASTMASAGSDVILVDADLRQPRVARLLQIAEEAGLWSVLVEAADLDRALVELDGPKRADGGRLRVLPAGPPPPNPSELLASMRMQGVVEELVGICEIVIIDSTPLLVVSDALPLVSVVSGILAVARLDHTSTDAVGRLGRVIDNAGGTLLGTVATGATGSGPYGPGYGGQPHRIGMAQVIRSSLRRLRYGGRASSAAKRPEQAEPVVREAP
jgi:non-specific protein-tyrosine kinase